jgi:hypothetical protein
MIHSTKLWIKATSDQFIYLWTILTMYKVRSQHHVQVTPVAGIAQVYRRESHWNRPGNEDISLFSAQLYKTSLRWQRSLVWCCRLASTYRVVY